MVTGFAAAWFGLASASAGVVMDNSVAALCEAGGAFAPVAGAAPTVALANLGSPVEPLDLHTVTLTLFNRDLDGVACSASTSRVARLWVASELQPEPLDVVTLEVPASATEAFEREVSVTLPEPVYVTPDDFVFVAVELGTPDSDPGCLLTCHNFTVGNHATTYRAQGSLAPYVWEDVSGWRGPGIFFVSVEGEPLSEEERAERVKPEVRLNPKTMKLEPVGDRSIH